MTVLKFKQLTASATPPTRGTPQSAGFDLSSDSKHSVILGIGETATVSTGIAVEIPPGYVGMVCPRSGLAAKHGITVLNAPGIIDADYRGELKVLLINHGLERFSFKHGDRIAQLVITSAPEFTVEEISDLSTTVRGTSGFGSTGVSTTL